MEKDINEYKSRYNIEKLTKYYMIGKSWKAGEKISISNKIKFLFNYQNLLEIRQRIMCKVILFKDKRNRK